MCITIIPILIFVIALAVLSKGGFIYGSLVKRRMFLVNAKHIKEVLFEHHAATRQQHHGTEHSSSQRLLVAYKGLISSQKQKTFEALFYQSKIKDWVEFMVQCTELMLGQLQDNVGNNLIEIGKYIRVLTAHIMWGIEFDGGFEEGIRLARSLSQLHQMSDKSGRFAWITRFFPFSEYNRRLKEIKFQVKELLTENIERRVNSVAIGRANSHGVDFLGRLLNEMYERLGSIDVQLNVDELMTCLCAGEESTTHLVTSSLLLLARNERWQEQVCDEINHICNGHPPTADQLQKFNLLNLVIKESLRLNPPVTVIERLVCDDIRLRDGVCIPKGTSIFIPLTDINQSKEIWGDDVNEFKPLRFASDGDSNAKARQHFVPFSAGPGHCPGQYYALMQTKIILVMLISRFRFI